MIMHLGMDGHITRRQFALLNRANGGIGSIYKSLLASTYYWLQLRSHHYIVASVLRITAYANRLVLPSFPYFPFHYDLLRTLLTFSGRSNLQKQIQSSTQGR